MAMVSLQFYKNKYRYPHYSESLTIYGTPMICTPVGINLKGGKIRVEGYFSDFMSCNYLKIINDGEIIYGWIDDVEYLNSKVFTVSYSVDAWRTYKDKINLGTQYIARQPIPTTKEDKLLGSTQDYPEIESIMHTWTKGSRDKRVMVIQERIGTAEISSNTPVNPTPYRFYMKEFEINNWQDDEVITNLMSALAGAQTENIVTMYSIPYMDLSTLVTDKLTVKYESGETVEVAGLKLLKDTDNPSSLLVNQAYINFGVTITDLPDFLRVPHSVQIVIPEAGIIDIPDELLVLDDLRLRQDIDLFSGACNYMLESGDESYYTQSVRGSSISSIPIVSDPYDTYMSQNQNALATSLIGDVASIVGGIGAAASMGGFGAAFGAGSAINGMNNIMTRVSSHNDLRNKRPSNPPAFLGTALASNFNQCFWVVVTKKKVENADLVHSQFGYPVEMAKALTFPESGFIQTEACNVYSTDGSVPRWAIDEINANFDRGILVHTS